MIHECSDFDLSGFPLVGDVDPDRVIADRSDLRPFRVEDDLQGFDVDGAVLSERERGEKEHADQGDKDGKAVSGEQVDWGVIRFHRRGI